MARQHACKGGTQHCSHCCWLLLGLHPIERIHVGRLGAELWALILQCLPREVPCSMGIHGCQCPVSPAYNMSLHTDNNLHHFSVEK